MLYFELVFVFDAVIGKKNGAWYGNNMLDMTLDILLLYKANL